MVKLPPASKDWVVKGVHWLNGRARFVLISTE